MPNGCSLIAKRSPRKDANRVLVLNISEFPKRNSFDNSKSSLQRWVHYHMNNSCSIYENHLIQCIDDCRLDKNRPNKHNRTGRISNRLPSQDSPLRQRAMTTSTDPSEETTNHFIKYHHNEQMNEFIYRHQNTRVVGSSGKLLTKGKALKSYHSHW